MKTRDKLDDVLTVALIALHAMRGIEIENVEDAELAVAARKELQAAIAGSISLPPEEQAALLPLMNAWRKLAERGIDDGQDPAAWDIELDALIPEVTLQVVPATDDIDTSNIAF